MLGKMFQIVRDGIANAGLGRKTSRAVITEDSSLTVEQRTKTPYRSDHLYYGNKANLTKPVRDAAAQKMKSEGLLRQACDLNPKGTRVACFDEFPQ